MARNSSHSASERLPSVSINCSQAFRNWRWLLGRACRSSSKAPCTDDSDEASTLLLLPEQHAREEQWRSLEHDPASSVLASMSERFCALRVLKSLRELGR